MTLAVTPKEGTRIVKKGNKLIVPSNPIIPFIEGDGIGSDIWQATCLTLDAAIDKAYSGERKISWLEVYAGEKASLETGNSLPEATLMALSNHLVSIKGPLGTPVGEGFRSLNVALRKTLDLYICLRPVRWLPGAPSPLRHPERVDMVIFRENTEDLYAGVEFEKGMPATGKLLSFLQDQTPALYRNIRFPETSAFSLKMISKEGSQRLVRSAIYWAIKYRRRKVTLIHKGNIMKFTEGGFRNWGYEVAEQEFAANVYTNRQWARCRSQFGEEAANREKAEASFCGKVYVDDVIADAAFEQAITRPEALDVIATTNLNGDYLSDALAALVGGLGIAPGANINDQSGVAVFEATHGTAPSLAKQNKANPCSLILSAEMMLRYIGWQEAADILVTALQTVLADKQVTLDFYHQLEGAQLVSTSAFAQAMICAMERK